MDLPNPPFPVAGGGEPPRDALKALSTACGGEIGRGRGGVGVSAPTGGKGKAGPLQCGDDAPGLSFAAEPPRITRVETQLNTNARDALRSDWTRIGKDFGSVIAREEAASKR